MIYFLTGNARKFQEFQTLLDPIVIEQLETDLPEIQSLDPHEVIRAKLETARQHYSGTFIVRN